MFDRQSDDDRFAARLSRVLRAAEHFGDDFETRLVAAIRADRPLDPRQPASDKRRRWWAKPVIHLSPAGALAAAAGIALVAVLGVRGLDRRSPSTESIASRPAKSDTVTLVRFVFVGKATSVALVGDFNAWGGNPTSLDKTAAGAWSATVPLTNGRHEYAFIVDGKRWTPDPLAPLSSDDFDTQSSVITVGT